MYLVVSSPTNIQIGNISQWRAPIETQRVRLDLGDQIFLKIWNILLSYL